MSQILEVKGRIHNFWSFALFSRYLESALTKHRILLRRVAERGTSSTYPWTLSVQHKVVRSPR